MYEFLLRVINNGFKIYSIPKFLYKHLSTRPNSMFDIYSKTMPIEERKYWFNVALTESNFTNINFGYNAKEGTYGDMINMGIIDPTKVSRVALENAASIAGMFLTTECMIAPFSKELKIN